MTEPVGPSPTKRPPAPSLNITGTDAAKTYIVGVRARNDSGYGP